MECSDCRVRIGDVADINASTYSPKEKWPLIEYIDTGSVISGSIADKQVLIPDIDAVPSRARRKVKPNSVIYSMVRPNQRHYAILEDPFERTLVSTGFSVLDAKIDVVNPKYLYYCLTLNNTIEHFQSLAEQSVSTFPTLSIDDLANYEIKLPSLQVQERIVEVVSSLDKKIELNNQINGYLAA